MIIKDQVMACFNKAVDTYDQAAFIQAQAAQGLVTRLSALTPTTVLEIGCGTGLLSQHLSALFPHAKLLLTDIAPAMVEKCQARLTQHAQLQAMTMDGEACTASASFDLIVSSMTLHWFKTLERSIQQLKQKLTANGRLMFTMLGSHSLHEWKNFCEHYQLPLATPLFPVANELKKTIPELKLQTEILKETYQNSHAFLRTLKSLGAVAPRAGYTPMATKSLRKIIRDLNQPIEISYEIIYGELQN